MLRTVEGIATGDGRVALVELADLPEGTKVLVTVLEEDPLAGVPQPPSLIDWDDPEAVERRIDEAQASMRAGRACTPEEALARIRAYADAKRAGATAATGDV